MLYRGFASQAEIDAEYNVGALRPGYAELELQIAARSAELRRLSTSTEGSYTVAATYPGDSFYRGRTASVTLNIR